jgi:hypothetical protein
MSMTNEGHGRFVPRIPDRASGGWLSPDGHYWEHPVTGQDDGGPDENDAALLRRAFEVVLPIWEALGAVDEELRLTELGAWALPRALARSWGGDLEAGPIAVHRVPQGAPPGTRDQQRPLSERRR